MAASEATPMEQSRGAANCQVTVMANNVPHRRAYMLHGKSSPASPPLKEGLKYPKVCLSLTAFRRLKAKLHYGLHLRPLLPPILLRRRVTPLVAQLRDLPKQWNRRQSSIRLQPRPQKTPPALKLAATPMSRPIPRRFPSAQLSQAPPVSPKQKEPYSFSVPLSPLAWEIFSRLFWRVYNRW
jgi:hypothetical protein